MATYEELLTTYSIIVLNLLPSDTQLKYDENILLMKIKNALKIVINKRTVIGPDNYMNQFNNLITSELDSHAQQLPENRDDLLNSYTQTIRKLASVDQNSLLDSDIVESIDFVTRAYYHDNQRPDSSIHTQILNRLTEKVQARAINAAIAQAAAEAGNRARVTNRIYPLQCVSQNRKNKDSPGGGRLRSKKNPTARRRRSSKSSKKQSARRRRRSFKRKVNND